MRRAAVTRWSTRHLRVCAGAVLLLAATGAAAADSVYLLVPGVMGPSTSSRHPGWFDVRSDAVVLTPGAFSQEKNAVVSRCTATIQTRLGAAGPSMARLVGGSVGTITLDRIGPSDPLPLQRATLRNAVLQSATMAFDGGQAVDALVLAFDGIEVTTYQRNADGSLGAAAQASFDCLVVR